MSSFRARIARGIVGLSVVSLLASCGAAGGAAGGPGGEVPEAFTWEGGDRAAKLEACAAEEGDVTWYTSLAGPVVDEMVGGFNAEYPNIKVDVFRGEQTDVISRVVQENQAQRLQGDVVEVTSDGFRLLVEMGIVAPFASPSAGNVSERFTITQDGRPVGLGDRTSYVSFAYNTNVIGEADVPHSLQDLLEPALKGKLAITSSTTGVRFVGNVLQAMGDEKGEEFLRQLAAQGVRVEAVSGAALAGLVASGEATASPGIFRNHAQQEVDKGSPIAWTPLEPATANVGYAGVFKGADSPCSGMLFLDFLLGESGGKIYEKLQYPRPDTDLGFDVWVPDETFDSTDDYGKAYEHWSALFDELFS